MLMLGLETSCDETAAAVVADGRVVLTNVIASQTDLHRRYGGVVPEVASRRHVEALIPVLQEALAGAGAGLGDLDAIAVTRGPGLIGALLVGVTAAKSLALATGLPLLGVNHLRGHIYANFLTERGEESPPPEFPYVALIVSGGHTDLVFMASHENLEVLGSTRDDAAGEAFDKVARLLGLPYPGGPLLDRLAQGGAPDAVHLPRAMLGDGTFDFSFSGLKTAAMQHLQAADLTAAQRPELPGRLAPWLDDPDGMTDDPLGRRVADFAAGFQQAVADVLVEKTLTAARERGCRTVLLAGGVAANSALRRTFEVRAAGSGVDVRWPKPVYCTDNAAMIAAAGYYLLERGQRSGLDLQATATLPLR
jgi:N6-L-threonylcarbamoyladenine synthase